MTKVSDVLVKSLCNAGVKRVYGITGDSLNSITDSIYREKNIEWVHTRHEEVAAFAAGADAAISGQIGVCAGSCGPGNLHLINGLYDCQRNNVPVLAIAAQIPSDELGTDYFQATKPEFLFKDCSVYCESITHPGHMKRILSLALQAAISKRGVAVIVISGDVANTKVTSSEPLKLFFEPCPTIIPSQDELKIIASILNHTKKTTLLCGYGCRGARNEVLDLAKKIQAPIVHPLRGKEYIEHDNPYDVGMTGLIGFSSGYYAMEDCETLLILGSSFPYCQFYPSKAKIIQIDIEGAQLGKRVGLDVGVVGDIAPTIEALLPHLNENKSSTHLAKAVKHYQKCRANLDKLAKIGKNSKVVHPESVVKLLSDKANSDAIFTCDVGTPTVWAARYLSLSGKRKLLGSFNHGSMANALAQSIGAQCVDKKRQVIAICGDGGFSMLMGDILSLRQLGLQIKVVVLNNGTLGFVELEMKATGFLDNATSLDNPNFADMATSIGIVGIRVEKQNELAEKIDQFLSCKGPALLDVRTSRMELIMPPSISGENIRGFSLYSTKAILNSRLSELLVMAKDNLWR
jgi:pyruvate dehydrogenase (quinone)